MAGPGHGSWGCLGPSPKIEAFFLSENLTPQYEALIPSLGFRGLNSCFPRPRPPPPRNGLKNASAPYLSR